MLGYEKHLGGYAGAKLEQRVPRAERMEAGYRQLKERFGWVPQKERGQGLSEGRAELVARVKKFEQCDFRKMVSDYGGLNSALAARDWYQLLLEGTNNLYTSKIGVGRMFGLCGGSKSEVPLWSTLRHDVNANLVGVPSLAFGEGRGRAELLDDLLFPCDHGRREPVPKLQLELAELENRHEGSLPGEDDVPWQLRVLYSPRLVSSAFFDPE